jgi:hypothetical protein
MEIRKREKKLNSRARDFCDVFWVRRPNVIE